MPSEISAPKNTGGGGFVFEDDVCACLLAHMLAREAPFEPELGTIERLDFQTAVDGWYPDDVLVTTSAHRIALSIKSNAQFSASSAPSDFVKLAWEQWLHIGSSSFDRTADLMGLIMAPLGQGAVTALQGLTTKLHGADPAQFATRIATPHWASEGERELFTSFSCPVPLQHQHPGADSERARLLQRLRFRSFDFSSPASDSRKHVIRICELALLDRSRSDAENLWLALREIAARLRPVAGHVTRAQLLARLRERFRLRAHVATTATSELERIARIWASKLPDPGLDPTLLLPTQPNDEVEQHRPAVKALRDRLEQDEFPTLVEWHTAIVDQWEHVRTKADDSAHSFFRLPEPDARAALRDLAVAIVNQFAKDDAEYQGTVLRQLTELLALHKGQTAGIHEPMTWAPGVTLRSAALAIEKAVGARVEIVAVDDDAATVFTWSTLPPDTIPKLKRTMLTMASLLSGIPNIDTIEIGILAADTSIEGTDGRGPIGGIKIQFRAQEVLKVARTGEVSLHFWERVRAFVLVNDNAPGQGWDEVPFRRLEEWPC